MDNFAWKPIPRCPHCKSPILKELWDNFFECVNCGEHFTKEKN